MSTFRLFKIGIALVCLMLTLVACASQAEPTATPVPAEPVTLRLAIADAEGRPSEPYVLEFIEQVKTRSNGNITIEPTWEAGDTVEAGFEMGVIQLVTGGKFDLGLVGARAFDNEGITAFQALQAPFLIDNDALAETVAASDIATRMLDKLSSSGVVGLTLWPEDLRHPFSLLPDQPILSPEDFAGLTVRAIPSEVSYQLIQAMGGSPMMDVSVYQAAESGLRQGASLTGIPTATGNVVFFPKFQVLFADGAAFETLSEAQHTILREAAVATQMKAIEEHPSDVEAATAWCADGGGIVLASAEQVTTFETAAQPVFDSIEQDPFNAELIDAIRELKATTEPSPGVEACASAVAQSPEPETDTQLWSEGLPPNGVWQVTLTTDDIVGMGIRRSIVMTWAGTYTWTFDDGKAQLDYQGTGGTDFSCQADLTIVEDKVSVIYSSGSACEGETDTIQWRLDDDGLHLHLVTIVNAPFVENKAYLEAKPWQLISEP